MSSTKKTVILIDDDQSILRVFTRVLERKGYAVTAVDNGGEAVKQIEKHYFDAALIDVRLPDIEGTELLSLIAEKSPRTVKIVFTGSPVAEIEANANSKLMDALLLKPVKPEVLLDILEKKTRGNSCLKNGQCDNHVHVAVT